MPADLSENIVGVTVAPVSTDQAAQPAPCSPSWPLEPRVSHPLTTFPPEPCVYLSDRSSQLRFFAASRLTADEYHILMDANFRRSGNIIYQPICSNCCQCMAIRIPVARFTPSKSQRRCWRANQALQVHVGRPVATYEKFLLYGRYQRDRHGRTDPVTEAQFISFLYISPIPTIEFEYRDRHGKLLGVGICDVCDRALSSVYFYYDPSAVGSGLGIFSALVEIQYALNQRIAYYYLGHWIADADTMKYKTAFRPFELLHPDGKWRPGNSAAGSDGQENPDPLCL